MASRVTAVDVDGGDGAGGINDVDRGVIDVDTSTAADVDVDAGTSMDDKTSV